MAKNFDTERHERQEATRADREFVLHGETFHAKDTVRPEVLTRWDEIHEGMPLPQVLEITDLTLLALIEGGEEGGEAHDRYLRIRQDEADPIGVADLIEVGKWLVEVQTGRPTESPSASSESSSQVAAAMTPSEPPPAEPGTCSTDDSSSEDTPTGSED